MILRRCKPQWRGWGPSDRARCISGTPRRHCTASHPWTLGSASTSLPTLDLRQSTRLHQWRLTTTTNIFQQHVANKLCSLQWGPPCKWWLATVTQSFQLRGHRPCRWCGSSYSIRIPSLKFIGLLLPKIRLIFGHGINRPGDLCLWLFDL